MINVTAYQHAIDILQQASTPYGFTASVNEHDNYRRIWTRDGTINSIAALFTGNENLIATAKATIKTIFSKQHASGFIPSNVSPAYGNTSYGGTVGRADNPSWAIIGLCHYVAYAKDENLLNEFALPVQKCFAVMDAWEYNGKHLMYVPQSGDWADEYIQHGYVLFNQLLRVWALQLAGNLYNHNEWINKAAAIKAVIRTNFWNNQQAEKLYAPNLQHQLETAPLNFWFLGFNPSKIYNQFDLQANALALLLNIGNNQQNKTVIELIKEFYQQQQFILPSFFPAIENGDVEMEELKNNYAYNFRNYAHQFHNGGLWPVWNGWLAAALQQHNETALATAVTKSIHAANALNNYEFNECLHGTLKIPGGVARCTWSAGGAIIAEQSMQGKKFLFIN
jgi:Alkaline and neutral invertase